MSDSACPLCDVVTGLERTEVYRPASGPGSYRKVADLPTAVAVLGEDQFHRGYTLVIARRHATELHRLAGPDALAYVADMLRVARAVDAAFRPRKMNYELLGNTVAHLHWHLFPRHADDPNPLRPVWEQPHEPRLLAEPEYAATVAAIQAHLG